MDIDSDVGESAAGHVQDDLLADIDNAKSYDRDDTFGGPLHCRELGIAIRKVAVVLRRRGARIALLDVGVGVLCHVRGG